MDPSKPRDFAKALFWYRKAAEQGYAAAESQLGDLYQYGNGVPKDLVQARAWYQKAADQGDAGAKQSLANLDHEH
jgi:TPR repeat protein